MLPEKDTEHFDGSLIWNIHIFKIVSWRWYLTFIHSNLGSPFFGLSSVWVFFESLYIPYIYSAFLFCFVIYIYVFSTSSGLAEKHNLFLQGLSLVLYLYFRTFVFVLLNCEVFFNPFISYIFIVLFCFVLLFILMSSPRLQVLLRNITDFFKVWVLFCTFILELVFVLLNCEFFFNPFISYIFIVVFCFVLLFISMSFPRLQVLLRNVTDFLKVWVLFCTCILDFCFCIVKLWVLLNSKYRKRTL